ncbi:MAG TPA: hypothetical protein VKA70_05025 [Blastocatellia bacterium]|nr:hypothetical protein [Blastocatellia bacterium]
MRSLESFSCGEWEDAARPFCEVCDKTEPSLSVEPPAFAYLHEVREVSVDRLRPRDYVLIHTENSVYRFTIIEPRHGYGLLTGGSLGYHRIKATLVETRPASSPGKPGMPNLLRERSRAVFRLPGKNRPELLVTSLITKLVQVTGGLSTVSMPAG